MSTTVSPALPTEARRPRASAKTLVSLSMVLLCLGHMVTDMFSSAIATLQPVLAGRYSLSLTQAGILGGVYMFSSSVLQLPFGILSDRLSSRLFTVFGPLTVGVFFSILGWADGFPMLLAITILGGMGVAAFHPQSTTHASRLSGERRGLGVALFITCGTFGLALGPPYFSTIIERLGFDRFAIAMTPALIVCALLLWKLPAPQSPSASHSPKIDWAALRARRGALGVHYYLVVLRSIVQLGIGQFLTLYLVLERGMAISAASWILALFFLAASLGSFVGGNLADSIGGKRVVCISMAASAPFLLLFVATSGWLSIACLFVGALILLLTIPVNIVMAQELVPSQAGTVSAIMMGFAWGMAGITFIPMIGWMADRFGLETVLWGVAAAPLLGVLPALRLHPGEPQH